MIKTIKIIIINKLNVSKWRHYNIHSVGKKRHSRPDCTSKTKRSLPCGRLQTNNKPADITEIPFGYLKRYYPNCLRALRKILIQGLSSPQFSGCHELLTVRNTRSGCGIMIVARPLSLVTAVIPLGEPFGLAG